MSPTPTLAAFLSRAYASRMRLTKESWDTIKAECVAAMASSTGLRAEAQQQLGALNGKPGDPHQGIARDPQRNVIGHVHATFLEEVLA